MARFKGSSPAASAHAQMMRDKKFGRGDGGSGCALLPFAFLLGSFALIGGRLPL